MTKILKAPLKIADDVIARSVATKQSSYSIRKTRDCFAPLAMTDAFFEFLEVPLNKTNNIEQKNKILMDSSADSRG
jgi:hypothetical protein